LRKTLYNIDAHIASEGLDISLLGMSLIDNFDNFKITKDMLILEY
jgi:predicted aspartyl protease